MKLLQLFQAIKERLIKADNRKNILFVSAIIIFLAGAFFYFFGGTDLSAKIALDTDEFYLSNGEYIEGLGYYIDETADLSESKFFCGYNDIALHKGSYRVTIRYMADAEGNTCYFESPDSDFNSVRNSSFNLRSDVTSISDIIWVNDNSGNYKFGVTYCGTGTLVIQNILVEQTNDYLSSICTFLVLWGLIAVAFCVLYKNAKAKGQKQKNVLFGLLLLCLGSSIPLYVNYLFLSHDLIFHLTRIEGIKDGLLAGMFPVKIYPNVLQERGYAAPVMYGDIFLYIPALLRILGYTITDAYRTYVFLVNVATCLVSYWCVKRIFRDEYIGLLGSGLYTLSAYRFTNVYIRVAVGEYTAMTFLPLIFCGLYLIFEDKEDNARKEGVLLSIIGFTGIIQTHVLTCEMVGIFTIAACGILWKRTFRKKTFLALTKVVLLVFLINLWWLVPFFDYLGEELNINCIDSPYIQTNGCFLAQLLMPFTDAAGVSLTADAGIATEMPLNLGLSLVCGIIFFFYLFFFGKKFSDKKYTCLAVFSMLMGIWALFMSTIYFPYDKLSDFSSLVHKLLAMQFPWRFLVIATLFITISTCTVIVLFTKFYKPEVVKGLVFVIGISILIPYFYSVYSFLSKTVAYRAYDSLNKTTVMNGEYLPVGVDVNNLPPLDCFPGDGVILNDYTRKYVKINLDVENTNQTESYIDIPLLYYKGYTAAGEYGHEYLPVCRGESALVRVALPAGYRGQVKVSFEEPWYWRAAEACSLLILIFLLLRKLKKK